MNTVSCDGWSTQYAPPTTERPPGEVGRGGSKGAVGGGLAGRDSDAPADRRRARRHRVGRRRRGSAKREVDRQGRSVTVDVRPRDREYARNWRPRGSVIAAWRSEGSSGAHGAVGGRNSERKPSPAGGITGGCGDSCLP